VLPNKPKPSHGRKEASALKALKPRTWPSQDRLRVAKEGPSRAAPRPIPYPFGSIIDLLEARAAHTVLVRSN
jgi:hypothetical protein